MTPPNDGADRRFIVSVSGGKDSTAAALHLRERGIPFAAIHMATGWEHPDTDAYVRDYLPGVVGPITRLENLPPALPSDVAAECEAIEIIAGLPSPSAMVRWCAHKAMFPSRTIRFCTQQTKVFPARDYMRSLHPTRAVSVQGIRADESKARADLPEWEPFDGDQETWRPLIRWSVDDVIAIHRRHNVLPNPLYLRGASRVGCWPCIFARKGEIRNIARNDPARILAIRLLEALVNRLDIARHTARGVSRESRGLSDTAWFVARSQTEDRAQSDGTVKRVHVGRHMPIDQVVAWSRTPGRAERFGDGNEGCARWGLCDLDGGTP